MKHEITLTGYLVNPTGSIQVDYLWNTTPSVRVYVNETELQSANADILQQELEALRWLMYYLFALGNTPETMASQVGKKLIVDIAPAVQQSVSLV